MHTAEQPIINQSSLPSWVTNEMYDTAQAARQPDIDGYMGRPDIQDDIVREYLEQAWPFHVAAERIAPYVIRTPLQTASQLSRETGNTVLLKREDLQLGKSFKVRGPANQVVAMLERGEVITDLVTESAGNAGQGLAIVGQAKNIPVTVFTPVTAPEVKKSAIRGYGATVQEAGDDYDGARQARLASSIGQNATYISPFDGKDIHDGNGTIGLEILEDAPFASRIFIPVGGGGLAAGVGRAIKASRPDIRIIGVQYDQSTAVAESVKAGKVIRQEHVGIFSGGTAVAETTPDTLAAVEKYVDEVVTVSEDEIVLAINDFYKENRGLLEPAGALGIAGLKKYVADNGIKNENLVAICSGANIDPDQIGPLLERAAALEGKRALLSVRLPEVAGALERLCCQVIQGHNIRLFEYAYNGTPDADILIELSLAGFDDKEKVLAQLQENGYVHADHSLSRLSLEHAQHFVGGPSRLESDKEALFGITLPSKPGALLGMLESLGRDEWGITRFSYKSSGTEEEKILIGFKVQNDRDRQKLEAAIAASVYGKNTIDIEPGDMQQFIGRQLLPGVA